MKKTEKIISAILTILVGVLLMVIKGNFIGILMTVAGCGLIVFGVIDLFQKLVPLAVMKLVVGVLIIVCGWTVVRAVLYVVAAILLIVGILLLYDKLKRRCRRETLLLTICEYVMPCLLIVIGALLLFHQGRAVDFIFVLSGLLTIIEGGVLFVEAFFSDV